MNEMSCGVSIRRKGWMDIKWLHQLNSLCWRTWHDERALFFFTKTLFDRHDVKLVFIFFSDLLLSQLLVRFPRTDITVLFYSHARQSSARRAFQNSFNGRIFSLGSSRQATRWHPFPSMEATLIQVLMQIGWLTDWIVEFSWLDHDDVYK